MCLDIVDRYSLSKPNLNHSECARQNLESEKWWLKRIQIKAARALEHVRRNCGVIQKHTNIYCSNEALKDKRFKQEQSRQYLERTYFQNEHGQTFSLADLFDRNISNPKNRRNETMARVNGFQEVADLHHHDSDFITLTAPSCMHSHLINGKKNPKYQNYSVEDVHRYFTKLFSHIRAHLNRENLKVYGLRVVEPNHDGTPHWHLLLYMHPKDKQRIREIFKQHALKTYSNETGAKKHRIKFVDLDKEKGNGVGYVTKYVAKNIDGSHIHEDGYGNPAQDSAERICAWAQLHGIRQFQFLGSPSATLWRQLRKLTHVPLPDLEKIRIYADSGDWAAYVLAMGGTNLPRSNRPICLAYEHNEETVVDVIDEVTGEIIASTAHNNAFRTPKLIGFLVGGILFPIKKHNWTRITSPPG